MKPRIVDSLARKFIGMSKRMSFRDDKTAPLFRSFMPHVKNINNKVSGDVFDIQFFDTRFHYQSFSMELEFEKWAAVEVEDYDVLLDPLLSLDVDAGKYAVFLHRGPAHTFPTTLEHIYEEWFPSSGYEVDNRAHLGVMKEGYIHNDPNAEEEIWIPII